MLLYSTWVILFVSELTEFDVQCGPIRELTLRSFGDTAAATVEFVDKVCLLPQNCVAPEHLVFRIRLLEL